MTAKQRYNKCQLAFKIEVLLYVLSILFQKSDCFVKKKIVSSVFSRKHLAQIKKSPAHNVKKTTWFDKLAIFVISKENRLDKVKINQEGLSEGIKLNSDRITESKTWKEIQNIK